MAEEEDVGKSQVTHCIECFLCMADKIRIEIVVPTENVEDIHSLGRNHP